MNRTMARAALCLVGLLGIASCRAEKRTAPTQTSVQSNAKTSRAMSGATSTPAALKTFCNPLDLDYGVRRTSRDGALPHRHGADPVIVLFKNRYYLFSTWDRAGYRVSDDLIHWKTILFAGDTEQAGKVYTAPAVVEMDGWLYFLPFANRQESAPVFKTQDPDSGQWEKVADIAVYADPTLFVDPQSKKLFLYFGLDQPIHGVELDRTTFAEIEGTKSQLMPPFDPKHIADGWEICTWDNDPQSKGMRSTGTFFPCREGAWMTFRDGKYYLQYASPGTTVPGYADGLLVGDSPLGPFSYSQHSPISRKDTGFITSAGHSCLFQDRHQNWWRVVTMLIGVNERFERRIGLFPAGFDEEGIPFTRTELGDLPLIMPAKARDHRFESTVRAEWFVVSDGKPVTASSSLPQHAPELAADENIRTWWSARTGKPGEWIQIDLGEPTELRAMQINLADQDLTVDPAVAATQPATDAHQFVLSGSDDGMRWTVLLDRRENDTSQPHAYVQFESPVKARYLKLENVFAPGGGKFAVSDLRAFGAVKGDAPQAVANVTAERDPSDRRKVTLKWEAASNATGYIVRFGISPDKLYQNYQVSGGETATATLYSLNNDPPYFFRVDAFNDSGVTSGASRAEVK